MVKEQYTGQLLGGPDHGNLVTSLVPIIDVAFELKMYLSGTEDLPEITVWRRGSYRWHESGQCFIWISKPRSIHNNSDKNQPNHFNMSKEAILIDNLADMDD